MDNKWRYQRDLMVQRTVMSDVLKLLLKDLMLHHHSSQSSESSAAVAPLFIMYKLV